MVIKQGVLMTDLRSFITLMYNVRRKNLQNILRKVPDFEPVTSKKQVMELLKYCLRFGGVTRKFIKRVLSYITLQKLIVDERTKHDYVRTLLVSLI